MTNSGHVMLACFSKIISLIIHAGRQLKRRSAHKDIWVQAPSTKRPSWGFSFFSFLIRRRESCGQHIRRVFPEYRTLFSLNPRQFHKATRKVLVFTLLAVLAAQYMSLLISLLSRSPPVSLLEPLLAKRAHFCFWQETKTTQSARADKTFSS